MHSSFSSFRASRRDDNTHTHRRTDFMSVVSSAYDKQSFSRSFVSVNDVKYFHCQSVWCKSSRIFYRRTNSVSCTAYFQLRHTASPVDIMSPWQRHCYVIIVMLIRCIFCPWKRDSLLLIIILLKIDQTLNSVHLFT